MNKANILKKALILIVACLVSLISLAFSALPEATSSQEAKAQTLVQSETSLSQEEFDVKISEVSLPFIENQGQIDPEVKYYASIFSGTFFVTESDLTYTVEKSGEEKALALKEFFLDKQNKPLSFSPQGEEKTQAKVSYFIGNDESQWRSNNPAFNLVSLGEIYPNIEIKLKAYGENVEKLFYVYPQGNPEDIAVKLEGIKEIKIQEEELIVETEFGSLVMTKPFAYQEENETKTEIKAEYVLKEENIYGFKLENYDKTKPLIIDPLLTSTFLGGSGLYDRSYSLSLDSSANVYVTGSTLSSDFPTTPGAYDESINGGWDVFVSKFNSDLTTLSASTFLGGSNGSDYSRFLSLDSSGNIYVAGYTTSSDFPTTSGAYNESYNGDWDAFVFKLNPDLTILSASTFLGGSSNDHSYSLSLDSGNVYVTGATYSSDFPTTPGAYDESYNDWHEGFVSKFNSDLTSLLASTFLGGSNGDDRVWSLSFDSSGNVYVTGNTSAPGFPTTSGAYDESHNGGIVTFVSKFDSDLTTLSASTFLGGSGVDFGYSLSLDSLDNVYVTGYTGSSDFPTTPGAYDEIYNSGEDVFVSKFDSDLTTLSASTFLGGSGVDHGYSLSLDSGNVYVTGYTTSSNFPTTSGAYDESYNGGEDDVFVSKFKSDLTSPLLASTFLGGSGSDQGYSLSLDSGNVYVTGYTTSSNFPTTSGAYDESYNGGEDDVFVSKFDSSFSAEEEAAVPEFTTITFIIAAVCGFGIYFVIRRAKEKATK